MEWKDYFIGMLGAIIGSVATALGMGARIKAIEKDCSELKAETLAMFLEIREDVKKLLVKSGNRREGD
jgi:gas vesicle protein